jgi:hypothetical protein
MRYVRDMFIVAGAAAAILCAPGARAQTFYMSAEDQTVGKIYRANAGDSSSTAIVTTTSEQRPMMMNNFGDQLYWTTYHPGRVMRSNLDGTGITTLVALEDEPYTRAIEFYNDRMYWADEGNAKILSATRDGEDIRAVAAGVIGSNRGFWDFTIANNRIYWTSWNSAGLKSVALDGSDFREVILESRLFSIESNGDRLFMTLNNRVVSTNFNGTDLITLALVQGTPLLENLDIFGDRVYFANQDYSEGSPPLVTVESIAFNGSGRRTDLSVLQSGGVWQLHVVPAPGAGIVVVLGAGLMAGGRRRRRT